MNLNSAAQKTNHDGREKEEYSNDPIIVLVPALFHDIPTNKTWIEGDMAALTGLNNNNNNNNNNVADDGATTSLNDWTMKAGPDDTCSSNSSIPTLTTTLSSFLISYY